MKGNTSAATPQEYLDSLEEPRKSDIERLDKMIRETAPELEPYMQSGMLAYGKYHYKYESGREGDWCRVALASQKNYISLYACAVRENGYVAEAYRDKLPKASIGKSCIRFKRLSDVDEAVLREIVEETAKADFAI